MTERMQAAHDELLERARALFTEGLAALGAGDAARAENAFAQSLRLVPGRVSTLTNLTAARMQLGRHADALVSAQAVLATEPINRDALYHAAIAHARLGHVREAIDTAQELARAAPDLPAAQVLLGELLREAGQPRAAAEAFRRALALGADPAVVGYYLAAVDPQAAPMPATAPAAYVQALFDDYADGFDADLSERLSYRAPQELAARIAGLGRARFAEVLDLGCGTGLSGLALGALAGRLTGVDLSAGMLERARARGAYASLHQADIAAFLLDHAQDRGAEHRYDLIVAADVFIYVGALEALFLQVARVLAHDGVFAFSAEMAPEDGAGCVLMPSLRYAHSLAYLQRCIEQAGLSTRVAEAGMLRVHESQPTHAWYVICGHDAGYRA
jgi:predicted TPR repeat methyltransferase